MNPKDRPWTYNDEWILRHEFPRRRTEEVAKMLRRTQNAVICKAHLLGLKKRSYGIVWTDGMIELLKTYFPTMTNLSLSRLIGVSVRTLNRKAAELGLQKAPDFLEINARTISERISSALKRKGNFGTQFVKGVRSNPEGEFKPGHKESPETKEKRRASLRETWRRKKILKRYGLSSLSKGQD